MKNRQTGSVLIICLIVVCLSLCICLILVVLSRLKLQKEIKNLQYTYKKRISRKNSKKNSHRSKPRTPSISTPVTRNVIAGVGGNGYNHVYHYNAKDELTANARDIGERIQFVVKNNDD